MLAKQSALATNVLPPLALSADVLFQQSALAANVLSPLAHTADVLFRQGARAQRALAVGARGRHALGVCAPDHPSPA